MRISDWSSDVCSSDLLPVLPNTQDMPSLAAQVDALLDRGDMWGYLIDGHGLYAWGRDMAEARRHLEAFEFLLGCELELPKMPALEAGVPPRRHTYRNSPASIPLLCVRRVAPARGFSFLT